MVFQVIAGYLESRGLPRAWLSSTMTLGQMTEIGMLAALPWLFRRMGAKLTMALGLAAGVRVGFGRIPGQRDGG